MSRLEFPPRLTLGLGDHDREVEENDYLNADFEEPWRYELADGRLVVMSPCSEEHVDSEQPWLERLILYKAARPDLIQRVVPEAWVRIDGETYRIGDLGVYLVGPRSSGRIPVRVPELMFEILSPGQRSHDRDLVDKRAEYHAVDVLEFVIVDRFRRRVLVLTREPGGYAERVLTDADTYTSPLLPGLEIRLAEVF